MQTHERPTLARRSLLAGLSAAPAVIMVGALPLPALAHPAATATDAALIAQADLVVRLTKLRDRAHDRLARKEDAVLLAMPEKPNAPEVWNGFGGMVEHDVDPASDVDRRCTFTFYKPPPEYEAAKEAHADAMTAWEAERERLSAAHGVCSASMLCDALLDRVTEAMDELIAIPAIGPADMVAKAGAIIALVDPKAGSTEQEMELMLSLARDAIRIDGRAV